MDKIIFSTDLDATRGLAEDGKAFIKVDGSSIGFDLEGKLRSLNSTTVVPTSVEGHSIATIAVNAVPVNLYETISTLVASTPTCSFTYTNESGITTTISGDLFLSKLAGNALVVGSDGGLFFTANAAFNSSQVMSGDNTGTVSILMTPTEVAGVTSYLVKASTKLAPSTPSGKTNVVKNSNVPGAGIYVDPVDIISSLGLKLVINKVIPSVELQDADNTVLSSLPIGKVTNLGGTTTRGWLDLS